MLTEKRTPPSRQADIPQEFEIFSYCDLHTFVLIDKDSPYNGYINGTKLLPKSKKVSKWNGHIITHKRKRDIVSHYPELEGKLSFVCKGGRGRRWNGTYMHPLIIPYLLEWGITGMSGTSIDAMLKKYEIFLSTHEQKKIVIQYFKEQRRSSIIQKLLDVVYVGGRRNVLCGYNCIMTFRSIAMVMDYTNLLYANKKMTKLAESQSHKYITIYIFDIPKDNDLAFIAERYSDCGITVLIYGS